MKLKNAGLANIPSADTSMEEIIEAFAGTEGLTEDEKDAIIIPRFFVELLAGRALATVCKTIKAWKPDLIIRESCEYASLIAAEEANIPHVRIAVLHCDMEKRFGLLSADATDALRCTLGLASDHGSSLRTE